MRTEQPDILNIVNQIHSLPTLPTIVENVITLIDDPKTSSDSLAKTISSDAPIVSKILKLVNSAYYGLPRKISTLTQATVLLGFNTIKNLVLTASVFAIFNHKNNGNSLSFDREKFWEHSLGCAVASKVLSKKICLGLPEEGFIAGLVHDIGKIVIDEFLHQDFIEILNKIKNNNVSIREAENEVLGVDHTQIGKWLCDKWNFPLHIQDSVEYHHSLKFCRDNRKMAAIIHVADAITKSQNIGYSGDDQEPNIDPLSWEILNITEGDLSEIIPEVREDYEKAFIFLRLNK